MKRLDRLSALLEGLAPKVILVDKPEKFGLFVLVPDQQFSDVDPLAHLKLVAAPSCCFDELEQQAVREQLTFWMTFEVSFEGPVASLFVSEFEEPCRIDLLGSDQSSSDRSLKHIVSLIASETLEPRCGRPMLMDRAGDILLIGVLRALVANPKRKQGLLFALSNPQIARTLVAMHEVPSKNWSLESLADEAGMSRTSFINHFKSIMQVSPGKYLEQLRLVHARRHIEVGKTLKEAAYLTGYASASTLSRALNRNAESST